MIRNLFFYLKPLSIHLGDLDVNNPSGFNSDDLKNISKNRETISKELLNQADQLVDLLKLTYEKEFNINLKTLKY